LPITPAARDPSDHAIALVGVAESGFRLFAYFVRLPGGAGLEVTRINSVL